MQAPTRVQRVQPRGAFTAVDPWLLLTGASARIVAGFAADLLRLGLHAARRRLASQRTAAPAPAEFARWRCSRSCG